MPESKLARWGQDAFSAAEHADNARVVPELPRAEATPDDVEEMNRLLGLVSDRPSRTAWHRTGQEPR